MDDDRKKYNTQHGKLFIKAVVKVVFPGEKKLLYYDIRKKWGKLQKNLNQCTTHANNTGLRRNRILKTRITSRVFVTQTKGDGG